MVPAGQVFALGSRALWKKNGTSLGGITTGHQRSLRNNEKCKKKIRWTLDSNLGCVIQWPCSSPVSQRYPCMQWNMTTVRSGEPRDARRWWAGNKQSKAGKQANKAFWGMFRPETAYKCLKIFGPFRGFCPFPTGDRIGQTMWTTNSRQKGQSLVFNSVIWPLASLVAQGSTSKTTMTGGTSRHHSLLFVIFLAKC